MLLAQGQFWTPTPLHRGWGQFQEYTKPNPAPGAGFTITADSHWLTIVKFLHVKLTCSAQVAERYLRIASTRKEVTFWTLDYSPPLTASKNNTYNFTADAEAGQIQNVDGTTIGPIPWIPMNPGDTLEVSVTNGQTEDKLTEIAVVEERFVIDEIPNERYRHELHELAETLERMVHGYAV